MARFDYLEGRKSGKKARKANPPTGPGAAGEKLEAVYVRKETIRAVWRNLRGRGAEESVSELVEDLLIRWLRDRV